MNNTSKHDKATSWNAADTRAHTHWHTHRHINWCTYFYDLNRMIYWVNLNDTCIKISYTPHATKVCGIIACKQTTKMCEFSLHICSVALPTNSTHSAEYNECSEYNWHYFAAVVIILNINTFITIQHNNNAQSKKPSLVSNNNVGDHKGVSHIYSLLVELRLRSKSKKLQKLCKVNSQRLDFWTHNRKALKNCC